jgi:NADH dehydrogenase
VRAIAADDGDMLVELEDGRRIAAATVVWAAGLRAHPLGRAIGDVADDGRLTVDAALRVAGHSAIFAAGDMARAGAAPGHATLMSCQHAMPTGRVAGHNAVRLLVGAEPLTYSQPMYVTCLDLGAAGAMFAHGWQRTVMWTGADAKAVKHMINGRLIAPPAADNPELALRLADPAPSPDLTPDALAARWRAMLDAAKSSAGQTNT